jgi:xanthine dehydrogenase/oxidase
MVLQVRESSVQVGAAISLSALIDLLQENQSKSTSFEPLASHLSKIANIPVRNIGSWAGNLMLTHDHDNFPSDVFTTMAGVGAKVTIGKRLSAFLAFFHDDISFSIPMLHVEND